MEEADRRRLTDALAFALAAHGSQKRKGKDEVPYVSHLLQVAGLVLEYGEGDVTLAVAALLHDVVEDCDEVEVEDVARAFGAEVAGIVASCTDLLDDDTSARKGPWRQRKEQYIAQLRTADRGTRLVAACDKVHNLGNIVADVRAEGTSFLARFTGKVKGTLWYYEELADALGHDLPETLRLEYGVRLAELRRAIHTAGSA